MGKVVDAAYAVVKFLVDPVVAAVKVPVKVFRKGFAHIYDEPLVVAALVLGAVNGATDRSTWGFVAAGVTALLRAFVSPAA